MHLPDVAYWVHSGHVIDDVTGVCAKTLQNGSTNDVATRVVYPMSVCSWVSVADDEPTTNYNTAFVIIIFEGGGGVQCFTFLNQVNQ